MDQQYDISPEMRKLYELKKKQRAEAKEYFQKLLYNPHRPIRDGVPFDPQIARFNSLQIYRAHLFETTPKFYLKLMILLSPFVVTYIFSKRYRQQKEDYYRSGVEKYEDRFNKWFY